MNERLLNTLGLVLVAVVGIAFLILTPRVAELDAVLDAYVVQGKTLSEIVAAGFNEATVKRIIRLIDFNEYKRRQAAPGLKVTSKAFGVGRRVPIAQKYRIT